MGMGVDYHELTIDQRGCLLNTYGCRRRGANAEFWRTSIYVPCVTPDISPVDHQL
jgi:hypothetical protein